jgi:hypothetical protein
LTLRNIGTSTDTQAALHPQDARAWLNSDVYRLSVRVEGEGWAVGLPNALAAVPFGLSAPVSLFLSPGSGEATVTVTATSESDPSRSATVAWSVSR